MSWPRLGGDGFPPCSRLPVSVGDEAAVFAPGWEWRSATASADSDGGRLAPPLVSGRSAVLGIDAAGATAPIQRSPASAGTVAVGRSVVGENARLPLYVGVEHARNATHPPDAKRVDGDRYDLLRGWTFGP